MKALVTGGGGFIGSHLVTRLLSLGHEVRVLDNFSTGRKENLAEASGRIDLREGDLRDAGAVRAAMEGIDRVFHQAALASVARSVEDPVTTNAVNVEGTLNVLTAARDAVVGRVVYAASSSAYGDTPTLPKIETMPASPLSPYALQKFAGEQYCVMFTRLYGLDTVALRYFNVFGPRQDPTSFYSAVIPNFITRLAAGEQPTVHGDGEQSRDFTYIDNVVDANLLAAERPGAPGEVINVACGARITLNALLDELRKILGVDTAALHGPPRAGDVRHSLADIGKARALLGYEPKIGLREGLERTVAFFHPARKA
ncbi:MAG: SDR family oxidoreductase [Deltaproteobacteria bacterium]|nr:SDR family oxidoreductase [Deltaproteobacteria bacterium]